LVAADSAGAAASSVEVLLEQLVATRAKSARNSAAIVRFVFTVSLLPY